MSRYRATQTVVAVLLSAVGLTVAARRTGQWLDRSVHRAVGLPVVPR